MLVILGSCFSLAALGLLGAAVWTYLNQRRKLDSVDSVDPQKADSRSKMNVSAVVLGIAGMLACFLAVAVFGIYVWGFSQF